MPLLLYLVFILSGAAGLIYESIWSRYLGLFVGHSAYGQVIVLVIYLGGMSAGAAIAARYSERIKEPLVGYAIVEVIVGLIGLGFHDIFIATTNFAYSSLFPALAGGSMLLIVKWLLASALILPQSILLGATFPMMSAGLIRRTSSDGTADSGRTISVLYFANSIGAAAGVLIAGFYLIGLAGLPGTLLAAAITNLVVGLAVFAAVRFSKDAQTGGVVGTPDPAPAPPIRTAATEQLPMLWRVLLIVSAGTALSSFVYEIAWVRMLSLVLGSATHSFELMLSAFILGLALGAFWVRTRADSFRDPIRALGVTQWCMGALAMATLSVYVSSFGWMITLINGLDQNVDGYHFFTVARYAIALVVMLPATFCAGVTLPLITRTLLGAGSGERAIGAVYSVNTLGSIVGAGLAALVLMPMLGLKTMLIAGAVIDMALGVWLLFIAGRNRADTKRFAVFVTGATVLLVVAVSLNVQLNKGVLISGVFRYGKVSSATDDIVFYKDGRTATVSVRKAGDGGFSLATNGKPDASLSPNWFRPFVDTSERTKLDGDESTQILLPLITLAHAMGAKQGAVIGNGSGLSSHLLLGSPALERLVTIDIEPEMINASKTFMKANHRNFDDPRSVFVHDDAKSYFAASNQKFDLILSEPSNPWVSGVSGLFTDEFYQRIRTYLTPNGVFGQWLHLYEIDDGLVLSVIKAVHKNFPSYDIYLTADVDILIVASNQPELRKPDWKVFDLPKVAMDLRRFHKITGQAVQAARLVSREALLPLLTGAEATGANSDFYPTLDLKSEQTRYMKSFATGFSGLNDSRFDVGAALFNQRILPNGATEPVLEISRVTALALGAKLRAAGSFDPDATINESNEFREAANRLRHLRNVPAVNPAPDDWGLFFRLANDVEADLHNGTMGWADEKFYGEVTRFLSRYSAPVEAQDSWRFLHAIATYDWPTAAKEVDGLVLARVAERNWINADLLRDGAVVALLQTGDPKKAGNVFDRLSEFTKRKSGDLRVRLLSAHIKARDEAASSVATTPKK